MALTFTSPLLFLTFIYTVSSQLQPSYSQYFQYPSAPPPYPSSPSYAPSIKPLPESPRVYRPPPPPPQFPSYSSPPVQPPPPRFNLPPVPLSPPTLSPPTLSPLPALTPCDSAIKPPKCPSSSDAEVINNLAIALQYLVASYIMTRSPKNPFRESLGLPTMPVFEGLKPLPPLILPSPVRYTSFAPSFSSIPSVMPQQVAPQFFSSIPSLPQQSLYQIRPNLSPQILSSVQPSYVNTYDVPRSSFNPPTGFPNANFIGSSSYGDSGSLVTSFGNPYGPPPKPCSRCLMSPYEAIDTNRDFVTMDFY